MLFFVSCFSLALLPLPFCRESIFCSDYLSNMSTQMYCTQARVNRKTSVQSSCTYNDQSFGAPRAKGVARPRRAVSTAIMAVACLCIPFRAGMWCCWDIVWRGGAAPKIWTTEGRLGDSSCYRCVQQVTVSPYDSFRLALKPREPTRFMFMMDVWKRSW